MTMTDFSQPADDIVPRALYDAVQAQRRADLERMQRLTTEHDAMRLDQAELLVLLRKAEQKQVGQSGDNVVMRLGAEMLEVRPTFRGRLIAALLLPLARRAARSANWGEAQIYYECLAVLRPRPFLWKQIGNMLYQQGLYGEAKPLLEQVLKRVPDDSEANFLLERCKEQLGD